MHYHRAASGASIYESRFWPVRAPAATAEELDRATDRKNNGEDASMAELAWCSAIEIARQIRERVISSREVVDYFLARIAKLDKPINCVVTIDAERARREA